MTKREQILKLCEKLQNSCDIAHREITGLASGKRKWEMCIPAQETDSDIVLQEPLSVFQKQIIPVIMALVDRVEQLEVALEHWAQYPEAYGSKVARKALTTPTDLDEILKGE